MRRRRRTAAAAAAAATALASSGAFGACGSDDPPPPPEPRHPLTAVVHSLQNRFERNDLEGVCALMSRDAKFQAGEVAHGDPTTCPRDIRRTFRLIDGGGGWLDGDAPRVVAVRTDGPNALVSVSVDGWTGATSFVWEGGGWKLAGFFGLSEARLERVQRSAPARPFPPPGRSVVVSDGDGNRCGELSAARYPDIAGGCVVRVSARLAAVEMMTPFGGFKFGDCTLHYRVSVDGEGRTWIDEWQVEGPPQSGCSDIGPCIREREEIGYDRLPWKGRIRGDGDGGFRHHIDMCLRTCIGFFAGEQVLRLSPGDTGSGWRAEHDEIGKTGFRIGDTMDVEGTALEIASASPPG